MLTEQDLLNVLKTKTISRFDGFADYLGVTEDDLLESLISILDENPNFCYIFAKDKDNLLIYTLILDYKLPDNTLYIYNPIKDKFQIFFKDGHVDYPDWVGFISTDAFEYCENLTSITIPNSVTSIRSGAFEYTGLTSVTIPNSVTRIGNRAFHGCRKLSNITLSNSVISIGNDAFNECTDLTSITIPDSVTSIGEDAFRFCSSLTSITIPDSVTRIGKEAFFGCTSLTIKTRNKYVIKYCKENNIRYKEI